MKHFSKTKLEIHSGKWWEGPNQEVVRTISHNPPYVRYACHSYDGAICRTTAAHFLSRFCPIDEERATKLLRHPARTAPKVIFIP